jgi:hypothetical protein
MDNSVEKKSNARNLWTKCVLQAVGLDSRNCKEVYVNMKFMIKTLIKNKNNRPPVRRVIKRD